MKLFDFDDISAAEIAEIDGYKVIVADKDRFIAEYEQNSKQEQRSKGSS
jgi:hypothetical protein